MSKERFRRRVNNLPENRSGHSLVFGIVASRRRGNGVARFRRGEPGKVGARVIRGGGRGRNLMTPHPGVARTLYLAKKDLITRPQDRAWVDRFDFKKGPPSRGANPRSSIHPTEKLRYLPSRVERRRRCRMEKNKRRRRIERTITMSGGREVRAASGKAPGLPT
ncbi:Uncharacterized protein DBV15_06292 [Temnothorax longispinosus]|uniref:Uncharacterized protein n=1 Tax=Temnothorax longispinosus TaxID=300112 RepID=A0A4S2KIH3_9HYME|nr:Uncharacterized protein DBV15_06292 [Temnothorax longispinosus]